MVSTTWYLLTWVIRLVWGLDCIVSDNRSQFMFGEFKEFYQTVSVEHIMITPYHPRSNGQVEHFIDTFKRVLRKVRDTPINKAIQQFLHVYWVIPNKNTPFAMKPAEVMFARKIKSVFDKLLPNQSKPGHTKWVENNSKLKFSSVCFKATSPTERQVQWTNRLET